MNCVIINGRLTKKPEIRTIPSGTVVADISVAVEDGFGENKKTCFIDCVAWAKTAEHIQKFYDKGAGIVIRGRLSQDTWEDKNGGGKRSKHRITIEDVRFPVGAPKGEGKSMSVGATMSTGAVASKFEADETDCPF